MGGARRARLIAVLWHTTGTQSAQTRHTYDRRLSAWPTTTPSATRRSETSHNQSPRPVADPRARRRSDRPTGSAIQLGTAPSGGGLAGRRPAEASARATSRSVASSMGWSSAMPTACGHMCAVSVPTARRLRDTAPERVRRARRAPPMPAARPCEALPRPTAARWLERLASRGTPGPARSTPEGGGAGRRPSTCRSSGLPRPGRPSAAGAPRRDRRTPRRRGAGHPRRAGRPRTRLPVARAPGHRLVLTPRVVEQPEAEHEGGVDAVVRRRQRETGRRDAPPVHLAVPGRVAPPRRLAAPPRRARSATPLPRANHRALRGGLRRRHRRVRDVAAELRDPSDRVVSRRARDASASSRRPSPCGRSRPSSGRTPCRLARSRRRRRRGSSSCAGSSSSRSRRSDARPASHRRRGAGAYGSSGSAGCVRSTNSVTPWRANARIRRSASSGPPTPGIRPRGGRRRPDSCREWGRPRARRSVRFARGRRPRRAPRARLPPREAAHDAGPVSAVAERAAARLQPDDEPRPGRRLRRAARSTRRCSGSPAAAGSASRAARAAGRRSIASCSTRRSVSAAPRLRFSASCMLRGPQTPGELKQRTERLHRFAGLDELHETLEASRRARARRTARAPAGPEGGALSPSPRRRRAGIGRERLDAGRSDRRGAVGRLPQPGSRVGSPRSRTRSSGCARPSRRSRARAAGPA